jgi:hypothetical protein
MCRVAHSVSFSRANASLNQFCGGLTVKAQLTPALLITMGPSFSQVEQSLKIPNEVINKAYEFLKSF